MAHLCSRSCDKSLRIDIRLVDILEVSQADLGKTKAQTIKKLTIGHGRNIPGSQLYQDLDFRRGISDIV